MFTGIKTDRDKDDLQLILDDDIVCTWHLVTNVQESTNRSKEIFIDRAVVNSMVQEAYRLGQIKAASQLDKIRMILKE